MNPADARPRVVLLEDDPSLRRFAEMALEELAIELVTCARSSEALDEFKQGRVRLLLSDLMLVGESSLPLLDQLAADPALRAGARIVVLSAGLTPELHRRLEALGVWRVLAKPIGLKELERCVTEALAPAGTPAADGLAPLEVGIPAGEDEAATIARHFDGDAQLYMAFRQSCVEQFVLDAKAGDTACDASDVQALRRVAHNLKTVLGSLGHPAMSRQAAAIESSAAAGDISAAAAGWRQLRPALLGLTATGS